MTRLYGGKVVVPVGEMTEQVTLQDPPAATSDTDLAGAWVDLDPALVYAKVEPASARNVERIFASAVQGVLSYIVTMRNHDGVSLKSRVTWGSRLLYVRGSARDQRNDRLTLACEEVV